MPDFVTDLEQRSARPGTDQVEELAGQVLSVLAARTPPPLQTEDEAIIQKLIAAVRQSDEDERDRVVAQIIEDGTAIEHLIDHAIPAAARLMGEAWCSDGMSFADVTIGSARLQALLRDLARRVATSTPSDAMAAQVLMVVRQNDYHTLGAMVAVQQLRRLGVGVHVAIGKPDSEVLTLVASRDFDMVMVSTSGSEKLESLRNLVNKVRGRVERATPIVVGGTALGEGRDIVAVTGADFATADPVEALRRCGLKMPCRDAERPEPVD